MINSTMTALPETRISLKIAALAVLAGVFGVFCGCAQQEHPPASDLFSIIKQRHAMNVGVKFESRPFGYLDKDGQLKGFDVDLVREIARRLNADAAQHNPDDQTQPPDNDIPVKNDIQINFQQVLSSTRMAALQNGNVDLVAATMTITPDREKLIDFSKPYYVAHQEVMVRDQSAIRSLADLKNKSVLYVTGSTSGDRIRQRVESAQLLAFKSYDAAFRTFRKGEGDALTTDDTLLAGFMAGHCGYRLLPEKLSDEPYGIGFKKDESTAHLREQVDDILAAMQKDGTLETLSARWVHTKNTASVCH